MARSLGPVQRLLLSQQALSVTQSGEETGLGRLESIPRKLTPRPQTGRYRLVPCRTGSGFHVEALVSSPSWRLLMSEVRPFSRHDRESLTSLANRHVAAVLPGGAIPVSTLLSKMERDTTEPILDPWVIDRHTLVGIHGERVMAAVHLKRYGTDNTVSPGYRNAGMIDWIICDPTRTEIGAEVLRAAAAHLSSWNVRVWYADGNLPCLGVYGIPDAWPHVQQLLTDAGFSDAGGQIEVLYAGALADVPPPGVAPIEHLELRRVVGPLGVSFQAVLDDKVIGVFEVEDFYGTANAHVATWADEGNHRVQPEYRGRGVGTWLFRHGCQWLRLAGKERLLTYAAERRAEGLEPMEAYADKWGPYYARYGLTPINRTRRGWKRKPTTKAERRAGSES